MRPCKRANSNYFGHPSGNRPDPLGARWAGDGAASPVRARLSPRVADDHIAGPARITRLPVKPLPAFDQSSASRCGRWEDLRSRSRAQGVVNLALISDGLPLAIAANDAGDSNSRPRGIAPRGSTASTSAAPAGTGNPSGSLAGKLPSPACSLKCDYSYDHGQYSKTPDRNAHWVAKLEPRTPPGL